MWGLAKYGEKEMRDTIILIQLNWLQEWLLDSRAWLKWTKYNAIYDNGVIKQLGFYLLQYC